MANTAERRDELRTALIDAAERAVSVKGLSGLKARDLADEVGCAVGAIYNVFPDLDAIYFEVNSRTFAEFERFLAGLPKPRSTTGGLHPAIGQLTHLALAYFDFAVANQPRWRTLFEHRVVSLDRTIPEWYAAERARIFTLVEAPLGALRPDFSDTKRKLFARTMFSAVHGVVSLGLDQKLTSTPLPVLRDQVAELVTTIGKGLLSAETGLRPERRTLRGRRPG